MRGPAVALATVLILAFTPLTASSRSATYCAPTSDFLPHADTVLHGDVDGDGNIDTVSSHGRTTATGRCRAWLVVETDRGVYRTRVEPLTGVLLVPPALAGLIELRPGRRLDIAVIVWVGASTGFLDVYGLRAHRLRRLSPDAYGYAGSFGERSGVDCLHRHGARLVATSASVDASGRRYVGERDFYGVRAGSLRLLTKLTEPFRIRLDAIVRFPELASLDPFQSCTAVRGGS
jgi:hypothetical protein